MNSPAMAPSSLARLEKGTHHSREDVRPKTFTVKPLFHGNPGLLQGASVALAIDNALYVGTATGDRLLKILGIDLAAPREDVN